MSLISITVLQPGLMLNRFFYADERQADGSIKGMQIDGDAHADFYAQLASGEGEVPWHATFVKGQGYVKF